MGPVIILDKSAIQSLSPVELLFLFKHYFVNITPVLVSEIRGDLQKHDDESMSEREVKTLAGKLHGLNSSVNVHHIQLCAGSLAGEEIPTEHRQVIVGGGTPIFAEGFGKGMFFDEPPELTALRKWSEGDFSEEDKQLADFWHRSTQVINLEKVLRDNKTLFEAIPEFKDLRELRAYVEETLRTDTEDRRFLWLKSMIDPIGFAEEDETQIYSRWLERGMPTLRTFAPYAYYHFVAGYVFYLGVISRLIGTRQTNRADLEYVYYLPFCMVFCSGDRLHQKLASVFLDSDQTFVSRDELKQDLANIAKYWESFSGGDKAKHAEELGDYPPEVESSFTYQMWKKYMRPRKETRPITSEQRERLTREMRPLIDAIRKLEQKKGGEKP